MSFFVCLILISFTSAITGNIGNAKMILRAETGDEIEKYILVRNINDVSLDIELTPSGDLGGDIEMIDDSFTLLPGEEKNARFIVYVKEVGTTEGAIEIKFTPTDEEDGKNGVGLKSTVIVIAEKGSWFGDDEEETEEEIDPSTVSITGNVLGNSGDGNSLLVIAMILVIFLLVLMIVLAFVLKRNKFRRTIQ